MIDNFSNTNIERFTKPNNHKYSGIFTAPKKVQKILLEASFAPKKVQQKIILYANN